ncbi:MAG TPA: 4-(cytidine 5'-diphospho)-2-C-methyl-D-erythritol kinase [Cytophagales bacterium]|jgi:4-diphosphocytidyl-2-C-methyl-D-erythritol kinase|nr:4-(cytidine 5'-diphospho)-2-C-methyl-D-erythritol kinase [Cytophagales bacterium]
MIVFPNAKINLGLYITEKRPDGYHNLISCFYPVGWSDALEVIEAKKTAFSSSGLSIPSDGKENLVMRAYKLLRRDFQLPNVEVHLHKVIPTGAGLGGGSSDAAHMLITLSEMFNLLLEDDILMQYAAELGSDCSFFISNKPSLVTGRGEELQEIDFSLKGMWLVLVYPDIHISTKEAYSGISPKMPENNVEKLIKDKKMDDWRQNLKNDFEPHLFQTHPELQRIKEDLYELGADYAAMSGSGSAVFGLYKNEPDLKGHFSDFRVWAEQLKY